jgi:hypothetical protein
MMHVMRTRIALGVLVLLVTGAACGQPASTRQASPSTAGATAAVREPGGEIVRRNAPPRHDLSEDEARGGHTLARHVGRTDDQLRERLRRERNISAASTYTDRVTAEETIAAAVDGAQSKVTRWDARSGRRPNLVLDYTSASPVGRTLARGDRVSAPCARVVVVLRWDDRHDRSYVLTSYPECGR